MIRVRVPATTANVGSGFDSIGVALTLYNHMDMEECDRLLISSRDQVPVPCNAHNLVYRTVQEVYKHCGKTLKGLQLIQESPIPTARGLGSSSACIVGGILGANALLGNPLSQNDMVDMATRMEGHPDNTTPAFLGGFVVSVFDQGHVTCMKCPVENTDLAFVAFIPDFELKTEQARAALPKSLGYSEAIFNLSRAALLCTSMVQKQYGNLKIATEDALHQSHRLALIPRGNEVLQIAYQENAFAAYVSGAGSTLMAIVSAQDAAFEERMRKRFLEKGLSNYRILSLQVDNQGACIVP